MTIHIEPIAQIKNDYPWMSESWLDSAAYAPQQISALIEPLCFQNLGISNDLRESIMAIASTDRGFAPNNHFEPQARTYWHIKETIKSWFTGIKVVEQESVELIQEMPLFVLNSPSLPKAKTTYGESDKNEADLGWKIEVLGTGFGADMSIAITNESEFTSSGGDRKMVFAPLKVRATKAALYKRGVLQGTFLKTELIETESRDANGVRSVDAGEWQELTSSAEVVDRFPLADDKSADVAKYRRKYEMKGSFESKLGFKAFDIETSIVAKYATERAAEVTFELPAGKSYKLWQPSSMPGLFFDA